LSTVSATVGDFATLRVGGVAVTGGGGGTASPTNVPAFRVTATSLGNPTNFTGETLDTLNNFDLTTDRFTPNVPGNYLILGSARCYAPGNYAFCLLVIRRNGVDYVSRQTNTGTASDVNQELSISALMYLNGTTDYVDLRGGGNSPANVVMEGSLLASGNGLISGSTALGDRIVGSNANVVAGGGMVSISTGGVTGTAYFDTAGRLVAPGVSATGGISGTTGYFGGSVEVSGSVVSRAFNAGSATSINWLQGNSQYTSANCGAFSFSNMLDGGHYVLAVQGTSSGTCSFSHTGLTFRLPPGHGATTAGQHALYAFNRMGSFVYVSWINGM
jgi:hypothetical protein